MTTLPSRRAHSKLFFRGEFFIKNNLYLDTSRHPSIGGEREGFVPATDKFVLKFRPSRFGRKKTTGDFFPRQR